MVQNLLGLLVSKYIFEKSLICSFLYKNQITLLPNKKDFGQFGGGLSRFVATHIASKVQYLPSTFFKDYKSPIKVLKLAHFF